MGKSEKLEEQKRHFKSNHLNDAAVEEILAGLETSDEEGGSSSEEDDNDGNDDFGAFDMMCMDEGAGTVK